MLNANDFKKRNSNTTTLYTILPPLPIGEELISPVAITSYRDVRFAIMNGLISHIEDPGVAIVESQPTASVEVEYDNETSYNVRVVRYPYFQEIMDILAESGLGPNPTLLIKNLRLLYGDVFNGYYAMYHLNNFYIMSEEKLKPSKRYEMCINAYETPYELIHNLPEEKPKEYHFYEIKEVATEETIRIENSFKSERPKHYTTKSFEVVENDDIFDTELYNYHREAPEWFQYYHMTFRNGKYAPLYISDIGHIPIEIAAMAVKTLNIPAAIYQIREDNNVIYNDDIIYKIVTDDTDEIRSAVLENPTLYDAKNLVRRVIEILCNDRNWQIAKNARKIKKNEYQPTEKFDPWLR